MHRERKASIRKLTWCLYVEQRKTIQTYDLNTCLPCLIKVSWVYRLVSLDIHNLILTILWLHVHLVAYIYQVDDVCFEEFKAWRQTPTLSRNCPFIARIAAEDICTCLNFSNTHVSTNKVPNSSLIICQLLWLSVYSSFSFHLPISFCSYNPTNKVVFGRVYSTHSVCPSVHIS